MSHNRVNPKAGWVNERRLPKGPNGRALCRRCDQEVPAGRRTFCSAQCVHEWKLTTSNTYVRDQLWRRDHGVCGLCGLDTVAWSHALMHEFVDIPRWVSYGRWYRQGESVERRARYFELERRLKEFGVSTQRWFSRTSYNRGIWDADHIVPVVEGGGECSLDNYRTLCLGCHKRVTRQLKERMKQRRDAEKGLAPSHKLFED